MTPNSHARLLAILACAGVASPAAASDCDCSRRVGLCQAEAYYDGARISFTSQTEECSRISFSVQDQTAAITIRQGRGSAAFALPGAAAGVVPIEQCYVCDVAGNKR